MMRTLYFFLHLSALLEKLSYTTAHVAAGSDSRLIAYIGNWQSCPSAAQTDKYTHIIVAFAVSYNQNESKNDCNRQCVIGDNKPISICDDTPNSALVNQWKQAGKKVIVSFGGAGMGESSKGDMNHCWDYCFGKEQFVIQQLSTIVRKQNFDGVDISYKSYTNNDNALNFLRTVTSGLRSTLPDGSILTHSPMDSDLLITSAYYKMLKEEASSLDFIMPQYYDGIYHPVTDGLKGGSYTTISNYMMLVNDMFGGQSNKVVFGFCISDCSATGSNANAEQAVAVMDELRTYYECNGGAFLWTAEHDTNGEWSSAVSQTIATYAGCSCTPISQAVVNATVAPVATPLPQPVEKPTSASVAFEMTCPAGYNGFKATAYCAGFFHCVDGVVTGNPVTCGTRTAFDEAVQYCNWKDAFNCTVEIPFRTSGTPQTVVNPPTLRPVLPSVPDPDVTGLICPVEYTGLQPGPLCDSFFSCVHGVVMGNPISCAKGYKFDISLEYCNADNTVTNCPDWSPPRSLCPVGFIGYKATSNCAGYVYCDNGKQRQKEQSCGEGLFFDEKCSCCNWQDMVDCEEEEG